MSDDATRSRAAEMEAALTAYQETWQQIENERGEYVRANERHRLAMFDALRAAEKARGHMTSHRAAQKLEERG